MKTVDIANATASLGDYARRIAREPVIVTWRGKPKAALVSIAHADWETVRLSTHPKFMSLIERSRARQKAEGGISSEEMRRRLGVKRQPRRR